VVAIAAWATLACVVAVLLTAAVGVRTHQTELSSKVCFLSPLEVSPHLAFFMLRLPHSFLLNVS
jgi:hypothetical protein